MIVLSVLQKVSQACLYTTKIVAEDGQGRPVSAI